MKISTKGRYAVRIMLDIAQHGSDGYISLKDVTKRQGVSDKYSEQIINQLNKAGFVKSIRGARGGYMLSKKPSEYTIGMILRLMEGSLAPVACVEDESSCARSEHCVTIDVWKKLKDAIDNVVDNITLQDLLDKCNDTVGVIGCEE